MTETTRPNPTLDHDIEPIGSLGVPFEQLKPADMVVAVKDMVQIARNNPSLLPLPRYIPLVGKAFTSAATYKDRALYDVAWELGLLISEMPRINDASTTPQNTEELGNAFSALSGQTYLPPALNRNYGNIAIMLREQLAVLHGYKLAKPDTPSWDKN